MRCLSEHDFYIKFATVRLKALKTAVASDSILNSKLSEHCCKCEHKADVDCMICASHACQGLTSDLIKMPSFHQTKPWLLYSCCSGHSAVNAHSAKCHIIARSCYSVHFEILFIFIETDHDNNHFEQIANIQSTGLAATINCPTIRAMRILATFRETAFF